MTENVLTTKRREWWGWFGSAAWMFFMMYGFSVLTLPEMPLADSGTEYPFFFMAILGLSIIAFGFRFGNNPDGLSRIAFYTTPIAILVTAVFALLPSPIGSVLYAASPIFMAPAFTRRVYGVIRTAGAGKQLTRFTSAITACVAAYTAWIIIEPPEEIAFLIPALLAVPAWLGIRRAVTPVETPSAVGAFRFSKRLLFALAAAFVLLFWLDTMSACIHTHIVAVGDENSEILLTLLGFILPPVGFLLWGIVNDKGHERIGFLCGMMLFLAGIVIATLPGDVQAPWLIPLALTDGLGGSYAEFLILTIPVYFLINTKRPVLTAALGVAVDLISSALLWEAEIWLPEPFMMLGAPVFISAAISAISFVVLIYILFERHREKTLAAALYALLHSETDTAVPSDETAEMAVAPEITSVSETVVFLPEEKEIAMLLIEGLTKGEIARKLRRPAAEVSKQMNALREKVSGEHDSVIAAIAAKYKLTRRETDMLRCLRGSMTNAEIAAELSLSEETVKIHVRNLMKKLPLDSRSNVAAWSDGMAEEI